MPTNAYRTGGWSSFLRVMLVSIMVLVMQVNVTSAQDSTPSSEPAGLPPSEIDPNAPHAQTVAQGVAGLDGPVVWRVREVSLLGTTAPETGGFSFILQRTGTEIVRSELTGRRTRLEAGEAYFMATGDPFVRTAVGDEPVVAWIIELVSPSQPATLGLEGGTVLLTTREISNYPAGSFDVELVRTVLLPGESISIPALTGPALLMVTSGRVQADASGDDVPAEPVSAGTGDLFPGPFTVANDETQAAVIVIAAVSDAVEGAEVAVTQAAPQVAAPTPIPAPAAETPVPTPVPTSIPPQVASGGDSDSDNLSDELEAQYGSDPLNPDFDGDGIADGDEVNTYGTNPVTNDTDGDGLLDGEEVFNFGTNPLSTDSDGDGLPDGEEILIYGTNPLDPASAP